jgi:hypothetical protein
LPLVSNKLNRTPRKQPNVSASSKIFFLEHVEQWTERNPGHIPCLMIINLRSSVHAHVRRRLCTADTQIRMIHVPSHDGILPYYHGTSHGTGRRCLRPLLRPCTRSRWCWDDFPKHIYATTSLFGRRGTEDWVPGFIHGPESGKWLALPHNVEISSNLPSQIP